MVVSQMQNDIIKTLLVDDDEDDYFITKDLLSEIKRANYKLDWASTYDEALKIIARNQHDVYLIDYRLGEFSGLDLIRTAIGNGCSVPMILLTGQGDSEVDIEAMKVGAMDYLVKGQLDASSLERSIRYSIKSKQAEKALRISEKRFRDIAISSSDWIWEVDEEGKYTYVSENVIDVLGYKPEELLGKTPFDIMPEKEAEKIKEAFDKITTRKDNIVDLINWNVHKNGQLVCLQTSGVPILDDCGNLLGYRGVDKNITERERAEQMLRQSEEKYRSLVENISDGVLTTDLDEKILFANRASVKIFGYLLDELIGMNLKDIVIKDELNKVNRENQKRRNKEDGQYELTIVRKDGNRRRVFVSATPLLDNNGVVLGTIAVFTDISELKEIEREKQELREKLSRSQRMESLGILAGGVAHDLNNILGPLVAYPELIKMNLPPDSPIRDKISKIENSAQRASEVVQDLLTMARRGRYEMVPVNLNEVVETYLQSPDFFNLKLKCPTVKLKVNLDKNIPKIHGSMPHLSKVIMNLILNAFDAMPHGGQLVIETKCEYVEKLIGGYDNIDKGKYVILTTRDDGVGISERDYKRLFEPFYTKKEMGKSGSGLGLAIVYGVIKDHNGYIDVKSRVGHGSDFIIYLPVIEGSPDDDRKEVVDIRGCEKILVVDDLEEQRELATSILSSLGYNVTTVADGRRAVEYLKNNDADIVVLDMIMEDGFDGLDTYKEIIKLRPEQKAIIVSGFSETGRVKEAEKLGVGKYIRKPYTMQILGKAIREVLTHEATNVKKVVRN
ncbi:MAG: hypothetical protein B6D58_00960 [candidate division Zixibacteria bacterium 4484_95]|nr:MAG: hypothetical protein B6D58_00960 [candidate division Zixibacteria bacterium 4484_95]